MRAAHRRVASPMHDDRLDLLLAIDGVRQNPRYHPEPGEEEDPEESYEALPGFEAFG